MYNKIAIRKKKIKKLDVTQHYNIYTQIYEKKLKLLLVF